MNWQDLAGTLIRLGAPTIGGALGGPAGAAIAKPIGEVLATALGTQATPEAVKTAIDANPERVVLIEAEHAHAITEAAQAAQASLFAREDKRGWFHHAWRPGMSWLLMSLWLWNALVLPVVNAFGAGVAGIPWEQLLGFSGLWLAIYGGGHTIKSVMRK